jgi:hypothetical protein
MLGVALAAQSTMCHNILKGVLHRTVHKARIAPTMEPALPRLPGLAGGADDFSDSSGLYVGA